MKTPSSFALRFLSSGLLALALSSCGGGGDGGGGPTPGFTVGAPATLSVQAGSNATVQITVTRTGGFTGAVTLTLEGHPDGITHDAPVLSGSGVTAALSLAVASTLAPGSYTIQACGSATSLTRQCTTIALTVTPVPTGGFTLSLNPASLSIIQGQSGTATITVTRGAPFTGPVTLTVPSLPAGVSAAFDPAEVPSGSSTSTLTLTVALTTASEAYPLTIRGSATGVSTQEVQLLLTVTWFPGDFTMVVSPEALTVEQTKSGEVNITIERTGPESPVSLTLEGAPPGVTYAFVPASLPAGATTAKLSLSPAITVGPAAYSLTIRAAGGWRVRTAAITLTVTVTPGFTLQAVGVGVPQGRVGGAGINVVRQGGFAGPVTLSLEGALPAGVTASFSPSATIPADQNLAAVNFSVLATSPVGTYTLTLHGTAAGVPDFSKPIILEVRPAQAGNVTFTFCSALEIPIWFAYQDGSQQWTQVAPTGGTFNFPITSSTGGVAWVTPWEDGPGYYVGIVLATQAELIELGSVWCQHTPARKHLSGSVANVGSDWYNVSIGDASVEVHGGAGLTYQLNGVRLGVLDLVASKTTIPVGSTTSTMIIRRGIDYPDGGVIPLLDFASAEAFLTTTLNATVENLGTEVFKFTEAYVTAGGTFGRLAHRDPQVTTTPYMVVPVAKAQAGDFYNLKVESSLTQDGTVNRMVLKSFDVASAQTLTLGPALTIPSVFQLQAAPFYQVRVVSTWQAEYGNVFNGSFFQDTRDGEFYVTRGYLGVGASIDVTTPDLRWVPGWNATWGPVPGALTVLRGMGYGWTGTSGVLPGFLGDFLTTPNVTVRTATRAMTAVP